MTTTKTTKTRAKPSGVKSESAAEAGQIRKLATLNAELTARLDRLETAVVALSQGNAARAQDMLESHL